MNDKGSATDVLSIIKNELADCTSFDFSVAFVTAGGIQVLVEALRLPVPKLASPHLRRIGRGRSTPCCMSEPSGSVEALRVQHELNEPRALLVSATGTGKTYLSALDVRQAKPGKVLRVGVAVIPKKNLGRKYSKMSR